MAQLSSTEIQEIIQLPLDDLKERLKDVNSSDLRKVCGFVGIPQQGKKTDMQEAIVAKVAFERGAESPKNVQSPEGRAGRPRSPRVGVAAASLRSAAERPLAKSPTVASFIGETDAKSVFPKVGPLPGFVGVLDPKTAGPNPFSGGAHSSTEGLEDDSWADTGGASSGATRPAEMNVDDDEDLSDISEAPEVTEQVTLQSVMRKLNTMEKRIKHSEKRSRERTRVMISEAVDPLKDHVCELQKSSVIHDNRIGKLETAVSKMRVGGGQRSANDLAHLRVSFAGFKDPDLDARFEAIRLFMEKYFESESWACIDTRMRGPKDDQKPSDESFVQFFCPQARERVLKAILQKKIGSFKNAKGDNIVVNRYKTDWQRGRDWAMRKAEALIKEKLERNKTHSKVEYKKTKEERKIIVGDRVAFLQTRLDEHGVFQKDFADLKLP